MRTDANAIHQAAHEAVLDVLLAATEAAVWVVVEAYPERPLAPTRLTVEPARDPAQAVHHIIHFADNLVAAVRRYRVLRDFGGHEGHESDPRQESLPF